jgi:hypothetical protein
MENNQWANPNPIMTMIFGLGAVLVFLQLMGFIKPEGALLVGIVQICGFMGIYIGSLIMMKRNEGLAGNLFGVFAVFFFLVSGLINIIQYYGALYHWPMDGSVVGYMWVFLGLYLFLSLPCFKMYPWPFFLLILLAAIALAAIGLILLGIITAPWCLTAAAWGVLALGVINVYYSVRDELAFVGINIPAGQALFKSNSAGL